MNRLAGSLRLSFFPALLLVLFTEASQSMTVTPTIQRASTLRVYKVNMPFDENNTAKERVSNMVKQAQDGSVFTEEEITDICNSLRNLAPATSPIKFDDLTTVLKTAAHLSHKDWGVTSSNGDKLGAALAISPPSKADAPLPDHAKQFLERILVEGNWEGAETRAKAGGEKPWAVLVTGVNGIRKNNKYVPTVVW